MKKLIMIAFALTLALSIVLVPSVAADGPYPIEIIKTIPAGGPEETFKFWGWRDMIPNGVFDDGVDIELEPVEITGAGTCFLYSPYLGQCIVCEELIDGSAYKQQPCQIAQPGCVPITFENELIEKGFIEILKRDQDDQPLDGATFEICPNPQTGEEPCLIVKDGELPDKDPAPGVILVDECLVCCECTVTEIEAPEGYEPDPAPQPAHVTEPGETVTLTFVNVEKEEKGEIVIYKVDPDGNRLDGSTFEICPNPKTCELPCLRVVDEGENDEAKGLPGVLGVTECLVCCECTVTEIEAPPGYERDPNPKPAHVTEEGEVVTLTFVNTPPEQTCGTVCAAQTGPGEFLFSDEQENWFTWIYYNIGWGTSEDDPYEYPIYTGATTLCGTLYVYDNGTHIFVNYVLTDTDGCTSGGLSEYHLQIDETFDDLYKHVMNKKNPVPGKCEYKGSFDPMVPATGWIEADKKNDDISGWTTAYIFAHGVGCYYCA
jgi:hypothetical protein